MIYHISRQFIYRQQGDSQCLVCGIIKTSVKHILLALLLAAPAPDYWYISYEFWRIMLSFSSALMIGRQCISLLPVCGLPLDKFIHYPPIHKKNTAILSYTNLNNTCMKTSAFQSVCLLDRVLYIQCDIRMVGDLNGA